MVREQLLFSNLTGSVILVICCAFSSIVTVVVRQVDNEGAVSRVLVPLCKEYTSSHTAVLGEAMKQELQRPKSSSSKKKEMKTKGTVRAEASQDKMSKKTIINKGEIKKSPSSVNSNLKEIDTKSLAKKSKERNLDSIRSKEEKSRKRKKEEEQNKPKSNSIKSSSQEAKRRKESKEGPEKMNSENIFTVQPPSKSTNAESRKQKPDMMLKNPKVTAVSAITSTKKPSVGTTAKTSLKKGNTSSKPEQGNNKKQKESGTHEKLKPKSPNSKVEARGKNHDSFSKKAAPSRSSGQTLIATVKEPRPSSIHQTHKDRGKKKNPKATKHEIQLTSLAEKFGEPNVRRLKIMRALGLIPPAASPFVKTRAHL